MAHDPRDHGLGSAAKANGTPRVTGQLNEQCPHCGCDRVYSIEVEIADPPPTLRRPPGPHRVIGRYLGCAACPWASPMMASCAPVTA